MALPRFATPFLNPSGSPIRELFPYLSNPGIVSFAGGYPSPSLFDAVGLTQAATEVLAETGTLQYGPSEGCGPLRNALSRLCSTRGIECEPEQLLVTSGSQQALDLLVRVLIEPGDTVLVETPAYPAAIQALRLAGAQIIEVPMDTHGLKTEALEEILQSAAVRTRPPKLVYTVPTFSNPRGTLLPRHRRLTLIQLARRYGFLIIEDDPYGELTFCDEPPTAIYGLAGVESLTENPVVYLGSLSKTVAPALRVGWLIGHREIVRRCTIAKQTVDLCTSPVTQLIAAAYLRSGRYHGSVAAARLEYGKRMRAMTSELRSLLGEQIRFDDPAGGMFLWVESMVPTAPKALFEAAVQEGVLYVPGAAFYPRAVSRVAMRLSFAAPNVDQIREGVSRLARAFHSALSFPVHQ